MTILFPRIQYFQRFIIIIVIIKSLFTNNMKSTSITNVLIKGFD